MVIVHHDFHHFLDGGITNFHGDLPDFSAEFCRGSTIQPAIFCGARTTPR